MNKVVGSVIITLLLLKQGYIGKMKVYKEIELVSVYKSVFRSVPCFSHVRMHLSLSLTILFS